MSIRISYNFISGILCVDENTHLIADKDCLSMIGNRISHS